jgi:hypothetical protein
LNQRGQRWIFGRSLPARPVSHPKDKNKILASAQMNELNKEEKRPREIGGKTRQRQ